MSIEDDLIRASHASHFVSALPDQRAIRVGSHRANCRRTKLVAQSNAGNTALDEHQLLLQLYSALFQRIQDSPPLPLHLQWCLGETWHLLAVPFYFNVEFCTHGLAGMFLSGCEKLDKIQTAFVESMMLLVLPSPVHQVILDEVEMGQVVIDMGQGGDSVRVLDGELYAALESSRPDRAPDFE